MSQGILCRPNITWDKFLTFCLRSSFDLSGRYFIICIFIGAFIGSFVFNWDYLSLGSNIGGSGSNEATVCCG